MGRTNFEVGCVVIFHVIIKYARAQWLTAFDKSNSINKIKMLLKIFIFILDPIATRKTQGISWVFLSMRILEADC